MGNFDSKRLGPRPRLLRDAVADALTTDPAAGGTCIGSSWWWRPPGRLSPFTYTNQLVFLCKKQCELRNQWGAEELDSEGLAGRES